MRVRELVIRSMEPWEVRNEAQQLPKEHPTVGSSYQKLRSSMACITPSRAGDYLCL